MKKLIHRSFLYTIAALVSGVFFREFTKWKAFEGQTALGSMHPHLLMLGAFLLLLAALFARTLPLLEGKYFGTFLTLHTIGLPLTVLMMLVRGVLQVLHVPLSKGLDAAVSGVAGLGHIILAAALVYMYLALKAALAREEKQAA